MRVKRKPKINSKLNALLLLSSSSIAFNWKSHYASSFLLFIATELFDFVDCWRTWRSPNRRIQNNRRSQCKSVMSPFNVTQRDARHHGGLACIYEWKKSMVIQGWSDFQMTTERDGLGTSRNTAEVCSAIFGAFQQTVDGKSIHSYKVRLINPQSVL